MRIIKEIMICLLALSSLSMMGMSSDVVMAPGGQPFLRAQIQSTNEIMQAIENTDACTAYQIALTQKIEQLGVDQLITQNWFCHAQPANLAAPQCCLQPTFKSTDQSYKNVRILISLAPLYLIKQLADHYFPTTLPQ